MIFHLFIICYCFYYISLFTLFTVCRISCSHFLFITCQRLQTDNRKLVFKIFLTRERLDFYCILTRWRDLASVVFSLRSSQHLLSKVFYFIGRSTFPGYCVCDFWRRWQVSGFSVPCTNDHPAIQSRTQSPLAFWSADGRQ